MSETLSAWRVVSSRVVVSDSWLTLRADSCVTSEGARIEPFYVIETADVVAVVAVTEANELVLVRQYRHGYADLTLELPAGRIEVGEEPVMAGLRELSEETGFGGGQAVSLRSFSPNTLRYANRVHGVLVNGVSQTNMRQDDPLERVETVLWPLCNVDELFVEPSFANATLAGVLAVGLLKLQAGKD